MPECFGCSLPFDLAERVPYNLGCSHTICKKCVAEPCTACPLCQRPVEFPPGPTTVTAEVIDYLEPILNQARRAVQDGDEIKKVAHKLIDVHQAALIASIVEKGNQLKRTFDEMHNSQQVHNLATIETYERSAKARIHEAQLFPYLTNLDTQSLLISQRMSAAAKLKNELQKQIVSVLPKWKLEDEGTECCNTASRTLQLVETLPQVESINSLYCTRDDLLYTEFDDGLVSLYNKPPISDKKTFVGYYQNQLCFCYCGSVSTGEDMITGASITKKSMAIFDVKGQICSNPLKRTGDMASKKNPTIHQRQRSIDC
jgi:hypothetical protein